MKSKDIAGGLAWRFAYDAAGERVAAWQRASGELLDLTVFLRDEGGWVLSDWLLIPGVSFGPKRDYLYAGDRLALQLEWTVEGPVRRYIAVDHLNSTRATIDDSGNVEQVDYYPFGGFLTGGPQPSTTHLFTGHERDTAQLASNLDYMHARYFSPNLGRFLSVDPVGGEVGSSQSSNRYSYVQNNPLAFVDPNGEETYVVVHGRGYTDTDLRGHNVGDLFRHAAETRAADIRASSEFDSAADSVVVVAAGNETEFADAVNADYASGPLKSIDVFSHGYEGGINFGEGGAGDTAKRMDIMEVNQLNPTMAPGASAQLYGCRTGLGDPSMAQAMANQLGVPVSGPTGPTWFTNPNPTAENPAVYQVPQGGQVVTYLPERPEEEPTP